MNEYACSCGMPRIETPAFPSPYTHKWHVLHKKVHVATFPSVDQMTLNNLDSFIEWSKEGICV